MSFALALAAAAAFMFGDDKAPQDQRKFGDFEYVACADGWSFINTMTALYKRPNHGSIPGDTLLEHGRLVAGGDVRLPFRDGPCVVHVWVGDWFLGWRRFPRGEGRFMRLACGGKTIYEQELTVENSFREWCRFDDYVYSRRDSAWDRLVKPVLREFTFDAVAKDGAVTIRCDSLPLAAALVASDAAEMKSNLAKIEAARRDMFAARYPWKPSADEPMPEGVKADGGILLFQKGGAAKVYPWSRPKAEDVTETIRAYAAKGEQELMRFGVLPLEDIGSLEIELGDFRTASGATIALKGHSDFWRERYQEKGTYSQHGKLSSMAQLDPESGGALLPYAPQPAEAGTPRMYVLDVDVPEDAADGDYFAPLSVKRDGRIVRRARLQLKVLPFALRWKTAAPYGFQMIYSCWARKPQQDGVWQAMERVCRFTDKYRFFNFHFEASMPLGKITGPHGDAQLSFKPEHLENIDRVLKCLDPSKRLPFIWMQPKYLFKRCGWKGYDPRYDMGSERTWTDEKKALWAKSYRDFERLLPQFEKVFREHGYPEVRWYFDGELDNFGIGGVTLNLSVADMFRRLGLVSTTVINGPLAEKMTPGRFDHVWANPATPISQDFIDRCRAKGTGFGHHNCGDSRFMTGFQFWRDRGDGRYQETVFYTEFLYPYAHLPWQWKAAQVYPTRDGGYAPTLGFLNTRDGRDDYVYMHTLEEMVREARAGSAARRDAEEFIARLEKKIAVDPRAYHAAHFDAEEGSVEVKTDEWNAESLERYRWAVARRISALAKESSR